MNIIQMRTISLTRNILHKHVRLVSTPGWILSRGSCNPCSTSASSSKHFNLPEVCAHLAERGVLVSTFPDTLLKFNFTGSQFAEIPSKAYAGFDPTAHSLHLGNLTVLAGLLHLFAHGVEVFVLLGGATALLGDPSGTTEERKTKMDLETVASNSQAIAEQIDRIFANYVNHIYPGPKDLLRSVHILDNREWYADKSLLSFYSEVGATFRLRHLMQKDAVKLREAAGTGMTYNEFSYQLLQAYDWLQLYARHGCALQLGGTDQIGNIHSGHDLIKEHHGASTNSYGLLTPLLTDDKGNKLGKSTLPNDSPDAPSESIMHSRGSAWLDPLLTSPYALYQYCFNLPDPAAKRFLPVFSFASLGRLQKMIKLFDREPEKRLAQKEIAESVVRLCHGPSGLESALRCTQCLYDSNPDALASLSVSEMGMIFENVPIAELSHSPSLTVLDLLLACPQLLPKSPAAIAADKRRKRVRMTHGGAPVPQDESPPSHTAESAAALSAVATSIIRAGGFSVNHVRVTEPSAAIVPDVHILPTGLTLIRVGKKNKFGLVRWRDS